MSASETIRKKTLTLQITQQEHVALRNEAIRRRICITDLHRELLNKGGLRRLVENEQSRNPVDS